MVLNGPSASAQVKVTDSIWVVQPGYSATGTVSLKYGDIFSAGWRSSRLTNPAGFAQCWAVDATGAQASTPFWSAWGRLQSDGTLGLFQFASVDPNQVWPANGGTCNVSLVSLQGNKQSVTAISANFTVRP